MRYGILVFSKSLIWLKLRCQHFRFCVDIKKLDTNLGSFVKKLKAWGGLQSNDMNIDWTPKRQSKKPFNNRQLKKK
jgi:hypothetical protein